MIDKTFYCEVEGCDEELGMVVYEEQPIHLKLRRLRARGWVVLDGSIPLGAKVKCPRHFPTVAVI